MFSAHPVAINSAKLFMKTMGEMTKREVNEDMKV